jgi:hypothetical protein
LVLDFYKENLYTTVMVVRSKEDYHTNFAFRKEAIMRNLIVGATMLLSTGSAMSGEYNRNTYPDYGYGTAASTMSQLGLKAGLRGIHVGDLIKSGDSYYPGYGWMLASADIHPNR